jgi:hypothetical protein
MLPRHVVIGVLAVLVACASASGPREYLDEKTAATISVVSKPVVFAHERPELAAHSREYVTLAAVAVNHTGAVDYYLFAYFWSTVDRRAAPGGTPTSDELIIAADDRYIRPPVFGHSPQDAGVGSAVGAPPGNRWTLHIYRSDLGTLHFLSEARQIAVTTSSSEGSTTYELWSDERGSLRALVRRLEGRD